MKILAVSDVETPFIYGPGVVNRFGGVGMVISCGDLDPEYLEYIQSALDVPLFYVRGNHDLNRKNGSVCKWPYPAGTNLHAALSKEGGLLLAGMEGSVLYNREGPQYTQAAMWRGVWGLVPALLRNRINEGRYLDIFVSHAPPWGIHDIPDDPPHHGFKAFRWLIRAFKPQVHLHGHIHVYHPNQPRETRIDSTRVINAYGYREIEISGYRRPIRLRP